MIMDDPRKESSDVSLGRMANAFSRQVYLVYVMVVREKHEMWRACKNMTS